MSYWQERYVCDKMDWTPEQRKERAQEKAREYRARGYYARVRKSKEGNRIVYKVFVLTGD